MKPDWVADTFWWHVYPLGFAGAPHSHEGPDPADEQVVHRLRDLLPWLDHVIELGLNGLALGPVFASATHGYDTTDFFAVDPRLGDLDDVRDLLAACRERGIRVLFDGVFNHVGDTHPAFVAALAGGPGTAEAELFHLRWGQSASDGSGSDGPDYDCFEGHGQLATLNHGSERVRELVTDVMRHWLDEGIDGWRLDAAYAVPTDFWAAVLPRVRESHPDCYLMGEVIHGDYPEFVTESGVDAVTQYELWKAIWSSLNDGNFHELAWTLTRHNEFLDTFVPWTFVGNHDVTRIASKLTTERALPLAVALLCTLPGTPAIYYGDEVGLLGVKEDRAGGDDAVRPAMGREPGAVLSGERAAGLFDLHRQLIAVRRRHRWLHTARSTPTHLSNTSLLLTLRPREPEAHHLLMLALNNSADEVVLDLGLLDDSVHDPGLPDPDQLAVEAHDGAAIESAQLRLSGYGWAILVSGHPADG